MGFAHYQAMLRQARTEWLRAMPAMSGLAFTESPLGPYSADNTHIANLALGLNSIDEQFVADMNQLLIDGKVWLYERLRNGKRSRCRSSQAFNDILFPTPEVINAANSMGLFGPTCS